MIGLDGSTAITATGRPAARAAPMSAATSVDLPGARRPGDPDEVGLAGHRVEPAQRGLGHGRAILDGRQEPGEGEPIAAERRVDRARVRDCERLASARPTSAARG